MKKIVVMMMGLLLVQGCQSKKEKEYEIIGNKYICSKNILISEVMFISENEVAFDEIKEKYVKVYPEKNTYLQYFGTYGRVLKIIDEGNTLLWYPGGVIDVDDLDNTTPIICTLEVEEE